MPEAKILNLKCPNCGGRLSVAPDVDTFACEYCRSTVTVERSADGTGLRLLSEGLSRVQRGAERTAAELAIRRLSEELQSARNARVSRENLRRSEVRSLESRLGEVKLRPVREIVRTVLTFFGVAFGSLFALAAILLKTQQTETEKAMIVLGCFGFGAAAAALTALRRAARRRSTAKSVRTAQDEAARRKLPEDVELDARILDLETRLAANRKIADS